MEGWLKKKGENFGALFWKDRWFKEEDGHLCYYTDSSLATRKGSIDIKSIKDARPRTDNFGHSSGFGFEIEIEGRIYNLMASREAEQLAWVNGILSRIDKKKKFVISDEEWVQSLGEAARSAVIKITNNTLYTLKRDGFKLHGAGQLWKKFPAEELAPGASVVVGSCSSTLLTGTAASVTYKTTVDLDEVIIWLRWENPFRKVTAGRKALSEAPSRFQVDVKEDLSQSSKSIADSDIYRVNYTITFDPRLESPPAASSSAVRHKTPHELVKSSVQTESDTAGSLEEDWVDMERSRNGPTTRPKEDGAIGQVLDTSFGATKYYADWIPSLKAAARSVLVTIVNETGFDCKRSDWSLKRGLWRAIPSEAIPGQTTVRFGTASHGLIGFRSGTIGSVTYILRVATSAEAATPSSKLSSKPSSSASSYIDYILTFDWKNHAVWGIGSNVSLTISSTSSSSPPPALISVLTESNNLPSCELIFKIVDQSTSSEKSDSASASASRAPQAPSGDENAKITTKTTITMRIQEEGVTNSLTKGFLEARREKLRGMKAKVLQVESDVELASGAVILRARAQQDQSFFDSIFSKSGSHLEQEAECISPTRNPEPITTPICPITGTKFRSEEEKRYCFVCGRIVHQSVIVHLPFPSACSLALLDLKKKPAGIQACLDCNDIISQSERPIAWKKKLAAAQQHPVHLIHSGLVSSRAEVKKALQDLRKMKIAKDKQCDLVVAKIEALLNQIDDLQMRLFSLNEESPRAEQKLHNTIALFVSNWKDEVQPELEALRSE